MFFNMKVLYVDELDDASIFELGRSVRQFEKSSKTRFILEVPREV